MKRILVIEDEPCLALFAEINLAAEGYAVVVDSNVSAALASMEAAIPDLVLLDLRLPQTSGWEFLRHAKADERFSQVPVVVVSAFASKEDRARAAEAGVVGYLVKPVSADGLVAEVVRVLGPGNKRRVRHR